MNDKQVGKLMKALEAFELAEDVLNTRPGELLGWILNDCADEIRTGEQLRDWAESMLSYHDKADEHETLDRIADYMKTQGKDWVPFHRLPQEEQDAMTAKRKAYEEELAARIEARKQEVSA